MASAVTTAGPVAPEPEGPAGSEDGRGARLAAWVFGVYVVAALPIVVFGFGTFHWFLGDDWDFLADRRLGSLDDLMRPHAEHWSTVPIILYRLEWKLFGLTYGPYQALTMVFHLVTVVLIRVVMRRAGVQPWIATAAAGIFVLFGPGDQNMLWSFQIGMVGSLLFGLLHLILAGRDGRRVRADWFALGFGLLGLMSSGIGPMMVAVVGLAVLIRRGWRMALFHTVPLGAVFLAWFVAWGHDAPKGKGHIGPGALVDWMREALFSAFEGIGYFAGLAIVFAVVLVVGLVLAWGPDLRAHRWDALRSRAAEPVALLAGFFAFHAVTANSRWAFGPLTARSSRYIYVGAFFLLPALAVAADALARRWRAALPVVLVVLLVPIPWNLRWFNPDKSFYNKDFHRLYRRQMEAVAWSPLAAKVDPTQRPIRSILGEVGPSVGWLVAGVREGKIDDPGTIDPQLAADVYLRLALSQTKPASADPAAGLSCRTYDHVTRLTLPRGRRLILGSNLSVGRIVGGKVPTTLPLSFSTLAGRSLQVEVDGLVVDLRPVKPATTFEICT